MYEFFEHTADLGLRVRAGGLSELMADAARGLFSMIVENLGDVGVSTTMPVRVEGLDPAYLLLDWLGELLAIFDTRRLVLCDFQVRVTSEGLDATVGGEPLDPRKHRLAHEVKAITYHRLRVEQVDGDWQAEVIVDI